VDSKDKKDTNDVVVCGARSCTYNKDSKCGGLMAGVITVIGIDGQCIRFEVQAGK
jgi:hypothetical protein